MKGKRKQDWRRWIKIPVPAKGYFKLNLRLSLLVWSYYSGICTLNLWEMNWVPICIVCLSGRCSPNSKLLFFSQCFSFSDCSINDEMDSNKTCVKIWTKFKTDINKFSVKTSLKLKAVIQRNLWPVFLRIDIMGTSEVNAK